MIGYRKTAIAASYLTLAVLLRVYGHIPGEGFLNDVTVAMVAYFGANLFEYHVKGK